jgi:Xaa-Pro aminopeptidase
MLNPDLFRQRRAALLARVPGPILLLGNAESVRNLPMNKLPFRQDSTFLYFLGIDRPDALALLDEVGTTVFLPEPPEDDALWHGPTPSFGELAETWGVEAVLPSDQLEARLSGRPCRTLAVAHPEVNTRAAGLLGQRLQFGTDLGDEALVQAVIDLRRQKALVEIGELRAAAHTTALAFNAVLTAMRPGVTEQSLKALFEGVLAARGYTTGYSTILTVAGEVLHNHNYGNTLQQGQLLLLDGGGEAASGYTVDVTRTWPVSGSFSPRQKAAYEAVLAANVASIAVTRPGVRYREVHDTSSRVLADWLRQEGLLTCSVDEALESGAHAAFFPHGVGHLLGLDVHDLENFGDLPAYPRGQGRPAQFGTRNLRLDLPLQAGWVVTIEPGFYVVPAILHNRSLRATLGDRVNWEKAERWIGFGGIRIEDDVWVTDNDPVVLTSAIPKDVATIEKLAGTGLAPLERLC